LAHLKRKAATNHDECMSNYHSNLFKLTIFFLELALPESLSLEEEEEEEEDLEVSVLGPLTSLSRAIRVPNNDVISDVTRAVDDVISCMTSSYVLFYLY